MSSSLLPAGDFCGLAPEKVFNGLEESIWCFQMRDMPDVRQLDQARAGNRLGGLFCQLRDISKIPAQIYRRTVFADRSAVFLDNDEKRRHLNLRDIVTNRLLVNHQGR